MNGLDGCGTSDSDPRERGLPRRRFLRATAGAGILGTSAGCVGGTGGGPEGDPTVFVFNQDKTVSAIDVETDEVVTTTFIGTTASIPANQYAIKVTNEKNPALWLNTDDIVAIDGQSLEELTRVETSFAPNYPNLTPDGKHLMVASGGTSTRVPKPEHPTHTINRIDADPDSSNFGEITGRLDYGKRGPCDMTVGPDGEYLYVPDVYEETFSVIRTDPLEVAGRVDLQPLLGDRTLPFMATASWDGTLVAVETPEGQPGQREGRKSTERYIDVSDPESPEEIATLTEDDGLGAYPLTSEFGPDNKTSYVFTMNSKDVTVVDLDSFEVETRLDLGGPALTGTWDPDLERLYVPVMSGETVKVIDHERREIVKTIDVGPGPTGATAGSVRPTGASD